MERNKQCCEICKKKYGVLNSQHQCKRCLRSICKDCGTRRKGIFSKTIMKPQDHRCCDLCWPQSEKICQYVKQNSLSFSSQSGQGKQWNELISIDLGDDKRNSSIIKFQINPPAFKDIWPSMTSSFRQFTGLTIAKNQFQTIDEIVKKTYKQITVQYNNSQLPHLLIIYLLCFSEPSKVGRLAGYLINIAQSVDQDEITSNIELLCANKSQYNPKTTNKLLNYAKNVYKSLSISYLLDCVTVDIVHNLITQTFISGTPLPLHLAISCLIFQFKQQIMQDSKFNQQTLQNYICQNANLKNMEKSIKILKKLVYKKNTTQEQKLQKSTSSIPGMLKTSQIPIISNQHKQNNHTNEVLPMHDNKKGQLNILNKLKQAQQLITKLQSGKFQKEQITANDLESMDKYLDYIISQNENDLKQCQHFQEMLNAIQQQLYNENNQIQRAQT